MTKWISYLAILSILIVTTTFSISFTKASFQMVADVSLPYKECTVAEKYTETRYHSVPLKPFPVTKEKLPSDLVWEDGSGEKIFTSPDAKRGGTYNAYIMTFPQTFRQIGPNANSSFRGELDAHDLALVEVHPYTLKPIPSLAKSWAVGKDKRSVYYKLDPDARWSDGVPVTADDFIFMLKLHRSKGIVDPWMNEYYSNQLEDILKFDDHTIVIRLPRQKPNLIVSCSMTPKPYHFYGNFRQVESELKPAEAYMVMKRDHLDIPQELEIFGEQKKLLEKLDLCETVEAKKAVQAEVDKLGPAIKELNDSKKTYKLMLEDVCESWNKVYNWKVKPNTGAFQLVKYMHGKWVLFKRHDKWWANDKKFKKYRFNPDFMKLRLISKSNIAFEYFKQHEIDVFGLSSPIYWYKKAADLDVYEKGYVRKTFLWNDVPRPSRLFSMNMDMPVLKDKNVRLGIAHSLNFKKMIDLAMLGDACQSPSVATGYNAFSNKQLKPREFDLEKAATYFEKAGFKELDSSGYRVKDGARLSFKLLFANEADKDKLLILKEEARKAGLELILDTFDPNTVFTQMREKKHELAWHGWAPGSFLFGPQYWGQYHGDQASKPQTNNFSNLNNKELNSLINRYRNSSSIEERQELSVKMQQIIHDECCSIPTYYVPFVRSAIWRWIKIPDVAEVPNCGSLFNYSTYWIDSEVKKETLKAIKKGKTFPKEMKVYDKYKPQSI